jgi:RNase P subunit RPR2
MRKFLKKLFCGHDFLLLISSRELKGFNSEEYLEIVYECRTCGEIKKIELWI